MHSRDQGRIRILSSDDVSKATLDHRAMNLPLFVRDNATESVVKSSTDAQGQAVSHGSEVQFMDSNPAMAAPAMAAPQACQMCQQPTLGMAPSCNQCNDWGCSSCRWAGHGGVTLNSLLYGNAQPIVSLGGWFSADQLFYGFLLIEFFD